MPIEERKKVIAGDKWSINTLPATKGLKVLTHIAAIMGSGAGVLQEAQKGGSILDLDLDGRTMGSAIAAVTERLDQAATIDTIKILLGSLHKDDRAVDFEIEFAANYATLLKIVTWALQENFSDFFAAGPGIVELMNRAVKTTTTSNPQTPIGASAG